MYFSMAATIWAGPCDWNDRRPGSGHPAHRSLCQGIKTFEGLSRLSAGTPFLTGTPSTVSLIRLRNLRMFKAIIFSDVWDAVEGVPTRNEETPDKPGRFSSRARGRGNERKNRRWLRW